MGQRSRSKDSIPLSNNLREVYKNMNARNVVEEGRIESQRLLMENYRKIDVGNMGYPAPMNLKRPN